MTDKGERKATGSYYTPDYIVQYIVEQTVGPVLAEVAAPFLDTSGAARDPEKLARAILSVNLLDPSMGSGHFLVAAAEFVARFLVEKEITAGGETTAGAPRSPTAAVTSAILVWLAQGLMQIQCSAPCRTIADPPKLWRLARAVLQLMQETTPSVQPSPLTTSISAALLAP